MKYSQTARVLSLIFHGIIALAFGCLGFYFGFFVVPEYFNAGANIFVNSLFRASYLLYFELAAVGLTLFLISTYGFVKALLSLNSSSDEKLVQSFSAFIADGWVASIFFVLQAVLLFDLTSNTTGTSNGSVAFVVVAALIVAIILLIATNIPMVKLFDGKDSSVLVTRLAWGAATGLLVMAVEALITLPGLYLSTDMAYDADISLQLWTLIVATAIPGIMLAVLGFKVRKDGFAKAAKFSNAAITVTGGLLGLAMLMIGCFELVGLGDKDSFYTILTIDYKPVGYGYPVMLVILGSLLIIGTVAFVGYSLSPKAKRENA